MSNFLIIFPKNREFRKVSFDGGNNSKKLRKAYIERHVAVKMRLKCRVQGKTKHVEFYHFFLSVWSLIRISMSFGPFVFFSEETKPRTVPARAS